MSGDGATIREHFNHEGYAERSVSDTRHAEFLSGILCREIELEFGVFAGIRWQVVGPDGYLTPLKALADIPDGLLAGAPSREVVQLSLQLAQPLSADPFVGGAVRRVAVGAGKIESAHLARTESLSALVGGLRGPAGDVNFDL
jgi:hypothetical protein